MTLLGSLIGARNGIEAPTMPLTSGTLVDFLSGPRSSSGVAVTEASSLGMPAVWRAVNLLGSTVASLPLHPYKRDGSGTPILQTSGNAAALLGNPHPDMTSLELWETALAHMLLWGNAYLWIGRDRLGTVRELWPIHPSRMRAGRTSGALSSKVYQLDGGSDEPLTDRQILHLPAFGYDGVCGVSPIRVARQGIGLALAAEEYGARLFSNGSLASGILQTEQRLMPAQADALAARWKAKHTGAGSAHETVILDAGAKFQQLTIPPGDAQFLESRRFQIAEVGRMFGIPPHMLGDTERSTSWGTGIEQQGIGFVVYTLRPWLMRIEQRLTKFLLQPGPTYAKYSVEGLLRGDSAQRAAFYTAMWNIGVLSTDEIRELEERSAVEGGATRYRPLNMGELGKADPVAALPAAPEKETTDA